MLRNLVRYWLNRDGVGVVVVMGFFLFVFVIMVGSCENCLVLKKYIYKGMLLKCEDECLFEK